MFFDELLKLIRHILDKLRSRPLVLSTTSPNEILRLVN
jgi:hypothetical protein